MLATLCAFPPVVGWAHYEYIPGKAVCSLVWSRNISYTVVMLLVGVFSPFLIMIICYYKILTHVRDRYRKVRAMTNKSFCDLPKEKKLPVNNNCNAVLPLAAKSKSPLRRTNVFPLGGNLLEIDRTPRRASCSKIPILLSRDSKDTLTRIDLDDTAFITNEFASPKHQTNFHILELEEKLNQSNQAFVECVIPMQNLRPSNSVPSMAFLHSNTLVPPSSSSYSQYNFEFSPPSSTQIVRNASWFHRSPTSTPSNAGSLHGSTEHLICNRYASLEHVESSAFHFGQYLQVANDSNTSSKRSSISSQCNSRSSSLGSSEAIFGQLLSASALHQANSTESLDGIGISSGRHHLLINDIKSNNSTGTLVKDLSQFRCTSRSDNHDYQCRRHESEEMRITIGILVVIMVFTITWSPLSIVNVIEIFTSYQIPLALDRFTIYMMFLQCAINPFIYGLMNRNIREGFHYFFCLVWYNNHS